MLSSTMPRKEMVEPAGTWLPSTSMHRSLWGRPLMMSCVFSALRLRPVAAATQAKRAAQAFASWTLVLAPDVSSAYADGMEITEVRGMATMM